MKLTADQDSVILWFKQSRTCNHGLGAHVEFPWSRCRKEFDAPPRIYLHLIWWSVTIALGRDGESQVWHHKYGNLYRWRRVTWHPAHCLQCRAKYTGNKIVSPGLREWECARLKWHRGAHA